MLRYIVICVAFFALILAHEPFVVQFQWNYINYTWPSYQVYLAAKSNNAYIAKNNIISGIKLWKDKMYLTVPRYKNGIAATLTVTSAISQNDITDPLLEPYPSWEMQKIGDCVAFQNVQNVEIDPKGRMWLLDSGRVAIMTLQPRNTCPPKLVILNLENNGEILKSYTFPRDVVNYDYNILNDIVIDHEHAGVAYITDSDQLDPGLIVYSLANNTSWKVYHESMNYVPDAVGFNIDNVNFSDKVNINGIALSPATINNLMREVYFSPLSSFKIFAVTTQALIDAKDKEEDERAEEIEKYIRSVGRKPFQTDAMVMSNSGKLYYGLLANNSIAMWDSKSNPSLASGQRIVSRDRKLMQWPSSFAFDDKGQLWCVSNRMQNYVSNALDINQPNYRVVMSKVGVRSYQYYSDGKTPELPLISANRPHYKVEHAFTRYGK